MHSLDDLDLAILAELESDARITVSELARRLDTPNSTIRDRISRLEKEGVIRGYTAIIDPRKLGLAIKAVVQVSLNPNVASEVVITKTAELPEATDVQILTGDIDELVTVYARDVDHLRDILLNKIGQLPGLVRISTAIVLLEKTFPLMHIIQREAEKN
jgi:DNA-binding Lrp family transcriptional regulator